MTQRRSRIRGRVIAAGALTAALVLSACNSGGGDDGASAETKAGETTTLPPREPGVEFPIQSAEAAAEDLAAIALQNFAPSDRSFGAVGKDGSWADGGVTGDNTEAAAAPATPELVSVFATVVDLKTDPAVTALPFAVTDAQGGCAFGIVYVDIAAPTAPKSKVIVAPAGATCSATAAATAFEDGGLAG